MFATERFPRPYPEQATRWYRERPLALTVGRIDLTNDGVDQFSLSGQSVVAHQRIERPTYYASDMIG
jgi:hypothetical protein